MMGWVCYRCHEVVGRCHAAAGCFAEAKASFDTALNINLKLFGAVQVRDSRERGREEEEEEEEFFIVARTT